MVTSETPDYRELFRTYLQRATQYSLVPDSTTPSSADPALLLHLLTVALKTPDHWTEARDLLFLLAPQIERDGYYSRWRLLLEDGIAQSALVGDKESQHILQIYLGNVYRIQSDHNAAIDILRQAAAYFSETDQPLWYSRACNGVARTLQQQGKLTEAQTWAEQALVSVPAQEFNEQAVSYRVIGGVALDQRQWEQAYNAFRRSLDLWRTSGDERLIAFGLANVGPALRALERYAEAEETLIEAVAIFKRVGDSYNEGIARINLGNLYLKLEQFPRAIQYYHRAERLLRRSNDTVRLAGVYNNWGMAYDGLKEWSRAKRAYEQSILYWERAGNSIGQANAMDNLSVVLFQLGQYEECAAICRAALTYLEGHERPKLRLDLTTHLQLAEAKLQDAT